MWRVQSIDRGFALSVTLVSTERQERSVIREDGTRRTVPRPFGAARAIVLDLPLLAQGAAESGTRIAVAADPWPGPFDVSRVGAGEGTARLARVERRATVGRLVADLAPGRPWLWDEGNAIEVELVSGTLSSAPLIDVLGGANAAAIRAGEGWEVVQFRDAEPIGLGRYRLRGLLRGQAGTEGGDTIPAGADFVRLDGAVRPIDLPGEVASLELLVAPANGAARVEPVRMTVEPGTRDLLPYRPVHGRAEGDRLRWTRRDRGLADGWALVDVPMSERSERYRVEHRREGTVLAVHEVERPEIELRGAAPGDTVRVAQLSALVGAGPFTTIQL